MRLIPSGAQTGGERQCQQRVSNARGGARPLQGRGAGRIGRSHMLPPRRKRGLQIAELLQAVSEVADGPELVRSAPWLSAD